MSGRRNPNRGPPRGPGKKKEDAFASAGKKKDDSDEEKGEEEVTRRIGGGRAAPNFGGMPSQTMMAGPSNQGPMVFTAPVKAQVQTPTQRSSIWGLTSVPQLPEFHPLERTAVFVTVGPQELARRITNVLRDRSIEASYDDAKAKVTCKTLDGVDFRIRLYQGRGSYGHGIIVEVQRRFGAGLNFYADTQAILAAAEGKRPSPPPATPSARALPEVSDDEDDDYVPPPNGTSSLNMIAKMLQMPGFDGQYLGLNTLSTLVDPDRMTPQAAGRVSTELLKADSEVGGKVFSYIINRKTDDENYVELRTMALCILGNAIRASGVVPEFLRAPLRPVLLEDIKAAEQHARAACCALGTMEFYVRGDEDAMELMDIFDIALSVGEERHAHMKMQAERCIAAIR